MFIGFSYFVLIALLSDLKLSVTPNSTYTTIQTILFIDYWAKSYLWAKNKLSNKAKIENELGVHQGKDNSLNNLTLGYSVGQLTGMLRATRETLDRFNNEIINLKKYSERIMSSKRSTVDRMTLLENWSKCLLTFKMDCKHPFNSQNTQQVEVFVSK
jgi:hypothetical protein